MSPSQSGIASAIAKILSRRAVVQEVWGPFTDADNGTQYRVKLNNNAVFFVTVKAREE